MAAIQCLASTAGLFQRSRHRPAQASFKINCLPIGMLIACLVFSACRDDAIAPIPAPMVPTFVLASGETVKLKDVPEVTMDLPNQPRSWDASDSAFAAALEESKHRAFIAFKHPGAKNVVQTKRLEVQEPWRPTLTTMKGTRARIDANSIAAGLGLLRSKGATVLEYYEALGIAYIEINPAAGVALKSNPLVDYLEPDLAKYELGSSSTMDPNIAEGDFNRLVREPSPLAFTQSTPWGISAVRAPEAWSLSTGTGARLLIVDTGHQRDHEDLDNVPTTNCFGTSGCTDDGNYPHGTWVSGVAIARNNAVGVVGVAPGLNSSDVFYWGACGQNTGEGCDAAKIIAAFNWAAASLGSKGVISMSQYLASIDVTLDLSNAVAAAWTAGHVIVASAGNTSSNLPRYPAAFSYVLGVSGLNENLSFAGEGTTPSVCNGSYSNYGSHVDLSAPFDAYTTLPTSSYGTYCGTSFATPHVAGAALIVRAYNPTWDNYAVAQQLTTTAQRIGGAPYSVYTGYGIVRADLAAGLYPATMSASLVSQKPRLSWNSIPLASEYRIYRRVFVDGVGGEYEWWATTTSTSWTDVMSSSSFFGYDTWPATGTSVTYHVTAVSSGGFEAIWLRNATFIPIGIPPE